MAALVTLLVIISIILLFSRKLVKLLTVNQRGSGLFWSIMVVLLALLMVSHPREVFQASLAGLDTWWRIVFPALLPFFIVSELFLGLGVVQFLGVLLEPIMRPVFNVPGAGSFVVAMGYTSGFPIGSIVTARLRKDRLCTRIEGERLFSFTNNASPLFMFGAVAVGMYDRPELGAIIAGSHYLANLLLGLALRFYGAGKPETAAPVPSKGPIFKRAARAMLQAQFSDGRPLGQLLGDSVQVSVGNLLKIGGFIILFSVLIKILMITGVHGVLTTVVDILIKPIGFSNHAAQAASTGFFEMTLGTKMASEGSDPLWQKLVITGAILGWSGLAIHAQVASIIAETDIRLIVFVLTRIGHALLAAALTFLFAGPWHATADILVKPVFLHGSGLPASLTAYYGFSLTQFAVFLSVAAVLAILVRVARHFNLVLKRWPIH